MFLDDVESQPSTLTSLICESGDLNSLIPTAWQRSDKFRIVWIVCRIPGPLKRMVKYVVYLKPKETSLAGKDLDRAARGLLEESSNFNRSQEILL